MVGFDVVVVTSISSSWFNATGIDNGDDIDSLDGAGHSVEENLSLAVGHSSDRKVWLTEGAFASANESLTIPTIANYCHGVVGSGYLRSERRGRHYVYYFNEDAIIREFCVHGELKWVTCADGTKVNTHTCVPPDWHDNQSDCEKCTVSGMRVRELADGTLEMSHQCVGESWIPVDVCDGVSCGITCDGYDLYSQKCVDGVCVKDALLEANSPTCGYIEPEPECTEDETKECADGSTIITKQCIEGKYVPTSNRCPEEPEPSKSPWVLLTVAIIGLYLYLRA